MRQLILFLTSVILLCTAVTPEAHAQEDEKPNILLITSDQLIPFLTGPHGNEIAITPNLDKMAQEGVLFDAAYTPNPICGPARASLMTGKYSTNIGAWDNASPLHSDEPTMCHYLSHAGYETVLSGKMHFVGPDQMHGYDRRTIPSIYPTDFQWVKKKFNKDPRSHAHNYVADAIQIIPKGIDLKKDEDGNLIFKRPEYNFDKDVNVSSGFNQSSHNSKFDKWAHFKAIDYLNEQQERWENGEKKPFFLTVSYNYPHEPFHPPQELWDLYKDADVALPHLPDTIEKWYSPMDKWLNRHHGLNSIDVTSNPESIRKVRRAYYALVTYVDLMVGELYETLEETGFDKNTIIIFASDHGDMLLEKGMVQKRTFYEWSTRVALLIEYPDNRFAGKVIQQPVSLIDIMPTILEMTGISQDEWIDIDGQSLVPLMDESDNEPRYVISETHSEGVYTPCFMVRKGDYKYNYFHGYGSQLFNLKEDPGEWNNLSGRLEHIELEREMRSLIFKNFDPDKIDEQVSINLKKRGLIQPVLKKQNITWEYKP